MKTERKEVEKIKRQTTLPSGFPKHVPRDPLDPRVCPKVTGNT